MKYIENCGLGIDGEKLAHRLKPRDAWAVGEDIFGLLHNLCRHHAIASLKIEHNNPQECGIDAWHTMESWFYEEDEEYKHDVLGNAMFMEKCINLNRLQVKLDQWLNRVAKAIQANHEDSKYFDDKAKFIMLERLVPTELENVIRTNKVD